MIFLFDHLKIAFRSAFRNFQKNILYGSLNILGLSIAFATVILIVAYLYQETSYESFHSKGDRIYRPTHHFNSSSGYEVHFARVPDNFINLLPQDIPEIERLIRFQNKEQKYLRIGDKRFKPKNAYVTDADVFKVFDFPLLEGDSETALAEPNTLVLTERLAKKYFSSTDVIGKEIIVTGDYSEEEETYRISGVMQNVPVNTHLPVDMLFSFKNEKERRGWAYVYTLLKDGADIKNVMAKIPDFIKKHTNANTATELNFEFQALGDIHLQSHLAREIQPNGNLFYIKIFFWVGLLVWLIALVNFTNLNTALAMDRGKEIGVRKVLGASKGNLMIFTLVEAVIYSLISLGIGALFAFFLFPFFSQLTGISIFPPMPYFISILVGWAILSGLLAGIFPALVLNSVKILQAIHQGKNWTMKRSTSGVHAKRIMISVQFGATLILLVSALLARHQFQFIQNKNLGIKPNQILVISNIPGKVKSQYAVFKNRLQSLPGVNGVTACMQTPSSEIRDVGPVLIKGVNQETGQETAPMMDVQIIDPDFIPLLGLELAAGEAFNTQNALNEPPIFNEENTVQDYLANTPRTYLINETAMKQLGWTTPEEAIGQEINWSIASFQLAYGPIKGVIKDYHQETLKNKVDPLIMTVEPIWLGNILIKVETEEVDQTIAGIQGIWNEQFPYTMEYHFLDELFNQLYQQDRVQLKLLGILTFFAILISFLGLISLVAYALKRRAKELAIRRVIGASTYDLTSLIGKEYFWILTIAILISIPISYYQISEWLTNFAYRVNISPLIYLVSIAMVYALVLMTVYLQTLKATIENPIHALREDA